ncbi:Translocon-associated protein (TRAP), alpha subunit [Corchorus capsularis]|uniref:Translocon-associated protein (TRAP), alpha subunit n=1 Tax=Corchorus capsularis TaxID=210143 RepID=A0A1R3HVY5_COCAP|nr:Translocon-associated protein (TRAP), alpha subunit [Corchorus capsularis]
MSGMGDGYVGTAQDAVRIRRLEKQREAERRKIQELKSKSASGNGQPGLLQFGSSTSEILETAFKKETVGLVTREQYVEKRVNIRNKIEEEEKEKLQKLQQEEEELQMQKRRKRKVKGNPRLSFTDDMDDGSDEEDGENESFEQKRFNCGKFGKDPTVETSFLPDSEREAEEQAERERLRKQWIREQEQIKNEPLEITYSYWDGAGHRRVIQVRKGDTIGEFLRAVQQQLAPEFREIRTTSVENLLYVKEDLIIPHQHSFYELIINKARGKSGPLFHFDVHEDVRTIADATIEKDESHAGKVVERHWYEKNKHIFPASRWEALETPGLARCQSEADSVVPEDAEGGDLGIVSEDVPDFGDGSFSPAPGVETVCVFPKNSAKTVVAGEETELLVGMENVGESPVNVIAIKASVHLPFDHHLLVQNLTAQAFNNATVPTSAQATFPYIFAVSKYLQPGTFDLVGTIVYEIDQHPYQNTFYNGTIEVVEAGGFISVESVFLVTLGIALLVLLGLWLHGQFQRISKKTKRAPKVEVGTKTTDSSLDEWLQGTSYTQNASKSKKKK